MLHSLHKLHPISLNNGQGNNNGEKNKSLNIIYRSCDVDEKNFNLTFEVTAKNLSSNKAKIYVGENEVFGSETVVPATNIEINANGKKIITASFSKNKEFTASWFEGNFEYIAVITCDGISDETDEFKLKIDKKEIKELVLKEVSCKTLTLTNDKKNEFISTVFCETGLGEWELREIGWVYFNLVSDYKFETALDRSSAHSQENIWYKSCMCYITKKSKFKDDEAPISAQKNPNTFGVKTFGEFIDSNIFKNNYKLKIDKIKEFIEKNLFTNNPKQKYKGWYGQGDWADMLIIDGRDKGKWHKARHYWWLQLKGEVTKKYVQILPSKVKNKLKSLTERGENSTSFIFDEDSIIQYFKDNPSKLPDINNIKSFKTDNSDGTWDLNFYLK